MMSPSYRNDVIKENEESFIFGVTVYNDVVVKEFKNHIRISMKDWNNYKQRLIPVLKQGEENATRNSENKESSTDSQGYGTHGQGD
jgi:hypothetical protein